MHSHFSAQTVAEIFRDLFVSERSGVLTLSNDEHEKRVYFDRGLILFVESTDDEDDLGRALLRTGKISVGALDEARSNVGQSGLPECLIVRDLVSRETLAGTVSKTVDRALKSVFQWEGGTAQFREEVAAPASLDSDVLSTFGSILQGIFHMSHFQAIHEAMLGLDNCLRLRESTTVPVERLSLSAAHGFILSRIDGNSTVRDILTVLPPEEEDSSLRFLYALLVMGILEYDPPVAEGAFRVANILRDHADRRALERMQERTIEHAYQQMSEQNPFEVLGVSPYAERKTIERAYAEAKSLFSRDRLLASVREKFRSELAVIESRLIEAYLKLSQPDVIASRPAESLPPVDAEDLGVNDLLVRVEMDKTKSKLAHEKATQVADRYYAHARKAVREGDFHSAIQYGKLAISYNENDARYYYLLADCQARNPGPRWQHQAEQNYTRATELDPWNADYFICLGQFYKRRGLQLRARKQFEEALRLSPQHGVATRELKALG